MFIRFPNTKQLSILFYPIYLKYIVLLDLRDCKLTSETNYSIFCCYIVVPFACGKFINITYDHNFVRFTLLTQLNLDILVYNDNTRMVQTQPLIKRWLKFLAENQKGVLSLLTLANFPDDACEP